MESDHLSAYRSRILREMNANRMNPFNSPPSSTGSHRAASPTASSVFSDPEGESTRKLNADIARITGDRKLPVNWDAAHRKWPEFFSKPQSKSLAPGDSIATRMLVSENKENKPSYLYENDDSTRDAFLDSRRTRAEMQPRVDNESDQSPAPSKVLGQGFGKRDFSRSGRNPSTLAKEHNRTPSAPVSGIERHGAMSEALERLRKASLSPKDRQQAADSMFVNSAKSSFTVVQSPPRAFSSHKRDALDAPSFPVPDVSHLGDFVTGTLQFSGSNKNGVPILVKNSMAGSAKHDTPAGYARLESLDVPEDEKKIFVSMDMIRQEIVSLQDHYTKVQEYAESLQLQVEKLEAEARIRNATEGSDRHLSERVAKQKNELELQVATLTARVETLTHQLYTSKLDNQSIVQERERALKKLQDACNDINDLTEKLSRMEKELESYQERIELTERLRSENDILRRDLTSLKHARDDLEVKNDALTDENRRLKNDQLGSHEKSLLRSHDQILQDNKSISTENKSLRSHNQALMNENEELREELNRGQDELDVSREELNRTQDELDASREELNSIRRELDTVRKEKTTLREENVSLIRHNEKYFDENKILRRENSGFEKSMHELHDENNNLKNQVEGLKDQVDHCRAIPEENFSLRLDEEETEENMTSAFFMPDITIKKNADGEPTRTKEMPAPPELTVQSGFTEDTQDMTKPEEAVLSRKSSRPRSHSKSRNPSRALSQNQKVSFSVPAHGAKSRVESNKANKGSKRTSSSHIVKSSSLRKHPTIELAGELEDTTGLASYDDATGDQAVAFSISTKYEQEATRNVTKDMTTQSRLSAKQPRMLNVTSNSVFTEPRETCPALSQDARRVLDNLCEHSCKNCIVCTRIASHAGATHASDIVSGKKRVTVPRPIPVTDRDLSVEDPTMRPARSPGHALALVIKGLEDESHHLQLELSRLQAQYNSSDKALGRRDRTSLAESIRVILKTAEVKNDQIYSLYDVLEGQKAAGQAMTEEEVEMTVMNITGMSVKEVTGRTDLTWEGVLDNTK